MSVSLPADKLIEIQQFAHALLQRQPIMVCPMISLLGKTTFYATGYVQLCQLCHIIQSDMLNVSHSPTHVCSLFTFLFQLCISSRGCLSCNRVQYPWNFLFLMCLLLPVLCPIIGPFIFRVLGFLSPVVAPCLVLYTRCSLPHKNSRLLHSCGVKWPFSYRIRRLPYIWITVMLKLYLCN